MHISKRKIIDIQNRILETSAIIVLTFVIMTISFLSQVKVIEINKDGVNQRVFTVYETVEELAKGMNVDVESTTINLALNDKLLNGTSISIDTPENIMNANELSVEYNQESGITQKIIEKKEILSYEIEYINNPRGYSNKIIQNGSNGQKITVYKEIYKDGQKTNTEIISEIVVKPATNKIIEVGQMNLIARNDVIRPTQYSKEVIMTPTFYDLCVKCCGKSPSNPGYGHTASGLVIKPGTGMKVIAVDTKVIPLGSRVYVESLVPGVPDYGYAVAADTGSGIKGNRVDLYVDTHSQGVWSGKNTVKVYILN